MFLLDVHNDEMIHNSHNGDAPSASPRNNSERPNGRQPSSSSSSPISIADSSMNHRHDESPSEESSRNLARGMAFFYRHVASRRHAQSPTNVPTAHASTISRTIISSNHVEEMTLPPSPNATLQATTSVALEENLDESPFSTVHHHDEPALSSTIEVTVATTVDDIGRECGTARAAPVSNIEHVNDNSPSDEVVCSVEEGRALPADELSC